ncbi:MAG: phosphoribosylformimino-5-aminoimidazole carboxamide ribotide isomerase [Lachnospiraceae bacterium]|nr:phosphoribosylformimino-5-aminoimidazole carboxamide ribotide isomerase [Lachnospiraceae bacterium]
MKFRPCIDIHNGAVKQIVGGSINEKESGEKGQPKDNFVSDKDASFYAILYRKMNLSGGHIALLNKKGTKEYEADRREAFRALESFEGGLQVGGGIDTDNACEFLEKGASHVIVTSFIFDSGRLSFERLEALKKTVGRERLVLDLSCRYRNDGYYVVTDRWQRFTAERVCPGLFERLSDYCDEFLVHGVDVEGLKAGVDERLLNLLSKTSCKITYAGGITSLQDIALIKEAGEGRLDFTIGSALKIFGGSLELAEVMECIL